MDEVIICSSAEGRECYMGKAREMAVAVTGMLSRLLNDRGIWCVGCGGERCDYDNLRLQGMGIVLCVDYVGAFLPFIEGNYNFELQECCFASDNIMNLLGLTKRFDRRSIYRGSEGWDYLYHR